MSSISLVSINASKSIHRASVDLRLESSHIICIFHTAVFLFSSVPLSRFVSDRWVLWYTGYCIHSSAEGVGLFCENYEWLWFVSCLVDLLVFCCVWFIAGLQKYLLSEWMNLVRWVRSLKGLSGHSSQDLRNSLRVDRDL